MTQRFIVLRGLPACGKSTWAKEYIQKTPNTAVISKDDIRPVVLAGRKWKPQFEKDVITTETELILTALQTGMSVISDNTNLNPKHIARYEQLARKFDISLEFVEFMHVTPEECVRRDLHRGEKAVGRDVIYDMYYKWIVPNKRKLPPVLTNNLCIVADLDGTLALFGDKNPYDRDFSQDEINLPVAFTIKAMLNTISSLELIIFSGRDSKFRAVTEAWLKKYDVKYSALYMRAEEDKRSDDIIKEEFILNYLDGKYNVLAVFDDRPKVVRLWHRYGIFCFNCYQGMAEF